MGVESPVLLRKRKTWAQRCPQPRRRPDRFPAHGDQDRTDQQADEYDDIAQSSRVGAVLHQCARDQRPDGQPDHGGIGDHNGRKPLGSCGGRAVDDKGCDGAGCQTTGQPQQETSRNEGQGAVHRQQDQTGNGSQAESQVSCRLSAQMIGDASQKKQRRDSADEVDHSGQREIAVCQTVGTAVDVVKWNRCGR